MDEQEIFFHAVQLWSSNHSGSPETVLGQGYILVLPLTLMLTWHLFIEMEHIWLVIDGQLVDSLSCQCCFFHNLCGLHAISDNEVIISQMPELTRVKDSDGDGEADIFETISEG